MERHPILLALLASGLLVSSSNQARGVPPGAACTPGAAHISNYTPSCNPLSCDLLIDPTGDLVPPFEGVRIGAPVDLSGDNTPQFFYDANEAGAGNRFHTELYSRFYNNGGDAVPSGNATVRFSVNSNATGPGDTSGIFTPIGDYVMDIPGPEPTDRLFPNTFHSQVKPICWILSPETKFPKKFMLKVEVIWNQDTKKDNNTLYRFYDLSQQGHPADIALVMDLSGSMSTLLSEGGSRLEAAKDRASMFIDLIEEGAKNRLGLFAFATGMPVGLKTDFPASWKLSNTGPEQTATLSDTAVLFPFQEISSATDKTAGKNAVANPAVVQPYGCTPVGQGLLRAKRELLALPATQDPARSPALVLFSDGIQNVGPYVNAVPPELCGGVSPLPLIAAAATFQHNTPALPIYSIFFGDEGGWAHQLMVDLQSQTGGSYVFHAESSLKLAAAYYQIRHLVASNALLFLQEDGKAMGTSPTAAVPILFDTGTTVATVGLAWPVGMHAAWLTVEARPVRGGDPGTWQDLGQNRASEEIEIISGAYRVFRFDPSLSTAWELRVRQVRPGEGTVPYTLAVFSPAEDVRLKASLGAESFTAGNALPIYADLRGAGHPVPDADVRATVTAPARPFSTTLRRYADRLTADPKAGDRAVPRLAGQLREILAREVGSPDLYPIRRLTVTLNDSGQGADRRSHDGIYTGALDGAQATVAGNYEITITATGSYAGAHFERTEKLGAVAAIGPIDRQQTEVRFSAPRQLDNGLRAVDVTVLAADRYGNATFPGAAAAITLVPQAGGGTLTGSLADTLLSTYSQTLLLAPGEEPAVGLQAGGTDLGSFRSEPAQQPFQRFEASFHLGWAVPHGSFARRLDPGPVLAVDATRRFTRFFAVRYELAASRFDDAAGGDRWMTHFVPFLQLRNPTPVWQPYFEAGPGLYHLESAGTAGGFAAGLGAQHPLTPHWRLDLSLHGYHTSGSLDATYSQIKIGLQAIF